MDAKTISQLLSMVDADAVKKVMKVGLRAAFEPCAAPCCKARSPGPACMACNEPVCVDHMFVRASAPTQPLCMRCIAVEFEERLADEPPMGHEDGPEGVGEPVKPKRRKRSPSKKRRS